MPKLWTPQNVLLFLFATLVLSIMVSPFVLSLSYFCLLGVSLFLNGGTEWQTINPKLYFKNILRQPLLWGFILYFLVVTFDFLIGPKNKEALTFVRLQLPFLLLPIIFANLPNFDKKQFLRFTIIFLLLVSVVNLCIFGNFLFNAAEINRSILFGKSIPTPYSHIRHSIITAISVLFGLKIWFWRKQLNVPNVLYVLTGLQILFLHFLAVRSGLVLCYLFLIGFFIYVLWWEGKWQIVLFGSLSVLAIFFISIEALPSLAHKVRYMNYDNVQSKLKKGAWYADSDRIKSLELAWPHILERPYLGHRVGMVKAKMVESYKRLPNRRAILPHAQFVFWLFGFGSILSVLALGFLWHPLFEVQHKFYFIFTLHTLGMLASMLVENTLLTAMGVAIYVFFSCFSLKNEVSRSLLPKPD